MNPLTATLIATIGVSLLSLSGLLVTALKLWTDTLELQLLSFAAAVLIATSLLSLLPEAMEQAAGKPVLAATLLAITAFYLLERLFEHGHKGHDHHHLRPGHAANARYLILIGDAIHNFVDGVVIAVAFMISPALGWTTTLSVAAHELPHEIGDYAVLVRGGYSPARALSLNLLSALTAVLGALAAFSNRAFVEAQLAWIIATAAGMFLYIAMANLIPEVQHSSSGRHGVQTLPFLLGLALIILLGLLLPHDDGTHARAVIDLLSSASAHQPGLGLAT